VETEDTRKANRQGRFASVTPKSYAPIFGRCRLPTVQAAALLADVRMILVSEADDLLQALKRERWRDAAQAHESMRWKLALRAELDADALVSVTAAATPLRDHATEGLVSLHEIEAAGEALPADHDLAVAMRSVLVQLRDS
jgi:hypothetical protein